jgi:hypothetical protein
MKIEDKKKKKSCARQIRPPHLIMGGYGDDLKTAAQGCACKRQIFIFINNIYILLKL